MTGGKIHRISYETNSWLHWQCIQQVADPPSRDYKKREKEYTKDSGTAGRSMGTNQPRKTI